MRNLFVRVGALVGALIIPNVVNAQLTGTAGVGLMPLDGLRTSYGVAFGYGGPIAGFEIEYAGTRGRPSSDHSSAGGIFVNVIVHPVTKGRFHFFAIAGIGMWGEKFGDGRGTGALGAKDLGAGVLVKIRNPLSLRLDYRMFFLGEVEGGGHAPSATVPQRLSVGIHLAL